MPDLPGTATNILHASTHQTDAAADTSSALVVTLLVDLDLSTVDTFRQAFAQLIAGDASPNADLLVFDLSRVDFVSIDGASHLSRRRTGWSKAASISGSSPRHGASSMLLRPPARGRCSSATPRSVCSRSRVEPGGHAGRRPLLLTAAPVNGSPDDGRRHRTR